MLCIDMCNIVQLSLYNNYNATNCSKKLGVFYSNSIIIQKIVSVVERKQKSANENDQDVQIVASKSFKIFKQIASDRVSEVFKRIQKINHFLQL